MTNPRPRFEAAPRVVVALCIIAVGVWWTAANLGWAVPVDVEKYWPCALIIIGVVKMASAGTTGGRVFGLVVTLVGGWIMVDRLYNIRFHVDDWWPLLLVLWGMALLSTKGHRRRVVGVVIPKADGTMAGGSPGSTIANATFANTAGAASPAVDAAEPGRIVDETVSAFAFWSGSRRRVASTMFRRADLAAVMGGVTLDLREAATATGEAVVDVFAMWGGINIRVPPDWIVSNEVVAVMGGTDDRSTGAPGARHRLIVRGFVIMGGVEIKP